MRPVPTLRSGNFLYVALNELKNLEKEVWTYAGGVGLQQPDLAVSPAQLHGIEKNQFAAELAQVVVWIGYLQWQRANGFFDIHEPILQTLHNIECRDAILAVDLHGNPAEPEWPAADVIVGNPPFLGGKRLRKELGDNYVNAIFHLYEGRVPREADLVAYWFERSRALIESDNLSRAGLLATQAIRSGASRKVLERINQTGRIFLGWSDRSWVLDGAAVRVSMVGFDNGTEISRILDGNQVPSINSNLTSAIDLTKGRRLLENAGICYMGDTKGGAFDISEDLARVMLEAANPSGRLNSDVVLPWWNGLDVTRRPRDVWIIDFGVDMSEIEASFYEVPFSFVLQNVKPERLKNNRASYRDRWWLHVEPRPALRKAMRNLGRTMVTASVAKYRLFAWLHQPTLPDHKLFVVTRDDDYFFGVLHSRLHEVWSLANASTHGDGSEGGRPVYNNTTCFETFPFPWPPGKEDQADPRVVAIAEAARELVRLRDEWLNPTIDDRQPTTDDCANLRLSVVSRRSSSDRTLTNLYNRRPDWLDLAHKRLDAAVFDAYGWSPDLSDGEILARLLALNLERAAGAGGGGAGGTADRQRGIAGSG